MGGGGGEERGERGEGGWVELMGYRKEEYMGGVELLICDGRESGLGMSIFTHIIYMTQKKGETTSTAS